MPSAERGSLIHLDISDNQVGEGEPSELLCKLILNATNLEFLNISDSNIKDQAVQLKVIDAIKNSNSQQSLTKLHWNFDIEKS